MFKKIIDNSAVKSPWLFHINAGSCNGCDIELVAVLTPRYDAERLGFKLAGTNVNVMALPGQVATLSATFDTPGDYNYICHEYCGYVSGAPIGHHTMYGVLTVLPADAAEATQSTN